ncbi:MAG: carboxymuconolactone decarboxylase family protein [Terriglobales bacterium]
MKARIDFRHADPKITQLLLAIESYLHGSSLGSRLQHLVKTRASQINGCAQCLDMHTKDARAEGESEQRLYALDAWRETPWLASTISAGCDFHSCQSWTPLSVHRSAVCRVSGRLQILESRHVLSFCLARCSAASARTLGPVNSSTTA